MTLEERIRDLASRGELNHLSIIGNGAAGFSASFTPASTYGASHGHDKADPIKAIEQAIDGAKMKRRRVATSKPKDFGPGDPGEDNGLDLEFG